MQDAVDKLVNSKKWLVLTGAGISAQSGVPTYRDKNGVWQRKPPVTHQQFMQDHQARQRFWSRNMVGWRFMSQAKPNHAHRALAELEKCNALDHVVTQNVDGLHQQAGSLKVTDLHGRIDRVSCMACGTSQSRKTLQNWLEQNNPDYVQLSGHLGPDGDAEIDDLDYSNLMVPPCEKCGGILKPDAVFYGDSVPKQRLAKVEELMQEAEGLVVIGSSLTVFSGYRFCLWAQQQDKPIVILNEGQTRADPMATINYRGPCSPALQLWQQTVESYLS
ncbi:MAG: NAD-dependent protein deacetylase [Porticoccaceae bacterium]